MKKINNHKIVKKIGEIRVGKYEERLGRKRKRMEVISKNIRI